MFLKSANSGFLFSLFACAYCFWPSAISPEHISWGAQNANSELWDDAVAKCKALRMRLPTRAEILTMVGKDQRWLSNGVWFWTSEESDNSKFFSYGVSLVTGEVVSFHKDAETLNFRCLRSTESSKDENLPNSQNSLGNRYKYKGVFSWSEAKQNCIKLGMRLPTLKELHLAYSTRLARTWYKISDSAIRLGFWSADEASAEKALQLNIWSGFEDSAAKYAAGNVMCIR